MRAFSPILASSTRANTDQIVRQEKTQRVRSVLARLPEQHAARAEHARDDEWKRREDHARLREADCRDDQRDLLQPSQHRGVSQARRRSADDRRGAQ